jgi:hypothetical protein
MSREIFALHGVVDAIGLQGVITGLKTLEGNYIKAEKALNQFGRQSVKIGTILTKNITAPLVAVGAAVALATVKTMDYAEKMVKLEGVTGLSTDTLQELQHVAKMMGVDFETVTGAVGKFARQLPSIAKEGGPAFDALKQLGVNIYDSSGQVRDINSLFPEMIKKIQLIENPLMRVAVAQQIFGRGAAELGPILGMTSEQFEAMRQEAHAMGIVLDKEALKAAETFGDEVNKLKERAGAMVMKLASEFIPILRDDILPLIQTKVIPAIQDWADKIKGVIEWFRGLDSSTKNLIMGIIGFTAVAGPFLLILGKTILAVKGLTVAANLLKVAFLTNPFGIALAGATALIAALVTLDNMYHKQAQQKQQAAKDAAINAELQEFIKLRKEQETIIETGESSHFQLYSKESVAQARANLQTISDAVRDFNKENGLVAPAAPAAAPAASNYSLGGPKEIIDKGDAKAVEEELQKQREIRWNEQGKMQSDKAEFNKKMLQTELDKIDEETNAWQEAYKKRRDSTVALFMDMGQAMGDAIATGIGEGGEGLKKSFREVLKVMVGFIERLLIASIAANTLKNFATLGPFGLLKAAGETALITAIAAVAKKGIESFAGGAFVQGGRGGVLAQVGEGRQSEIVMPMNSGIQALAEGIINRLNSFSSPMPALALAGGGGYGRTETHLHIGTLIADDRGLKELDRRMAQYRILEQQRRGYFNG